MPAADGRRGSRRALGARHVALIGAVVVFVVLALAGRSLGRAEPTGNYRPDLVPDTLVLGCYPLPDGVSLDFPYVVRRDGDVETASGERRALVVHWSLLDLDEVRERLRADFDRAGFEVTGSPTTSELSMVRPEPGGGSTRVSAHFTELDNRSPDPIVRGVLELDLPVVGLSSQDPACESPFVTKRFEQDE